MEFRMSRPKEIDEYAAQQAAAALRSDARARHIATGLLRTGRARQSPPEIESGLAEFVRLERRESAGSYWIRRDGKEVRSGVSFVDAEQLQSGFVEKMAAAGTA
jgi:hypothetical protein